jgi:diacylglycerol kinase (ATP)
MKNQTFVRRLRFAINGICSAFCLEQSFRIEVLAGAGVLAVLLYMRPSPLWWAIGALVVGLVLVAELFNTALEMLIDHLHPEHHPKIRVVKDIAAGAVLISSTLALLVAGAFIAANLTSIFEGINK